MKGNSSLMMPQLQYPDSKVHGANMGHIWGRQDPGGPHVGLMNLAIWVITRAHFLFIVEQIHEAIRKVIMYLHIFPRRYISNAPAHWLTPYAVID